MAGSPHFLNGCFVVEESSPLNSRSGSANNFTLLSAKQWQVPFLSWSVALDTDILARLHLTSIISMQWSIPFPSPHFGFTKTGLDGCETDVELYSLQTRV